MTSTLHDWLSDAPFDLAMSSGFFGFFAHLGLLDALLASGVTPSRVSGSSAGALVGGLWASGRDTDSLKEALFALEKHDFWDPSLGLGLLRGRRFRQLLDNLLVAENFENCRLPLSISAWDVLHRRTRVLDSGPLAPAIHASCCVPVMFQPVWISRRPYLDGGIADRPGLAGLAPSPGQASTDIERRTLYHHLASRSPWRRRRGAQTRIPQREGLLAVVIDGLQRAGPNRLADGQTAWRQGYAAMTRALEMPVAKPVKGTVLRVPAHFTGHQPT